MKKVFTSLLTVFLALGLLVSPTSAANDEQPKISKEELEENFNVIDGGELVKKEKKVKKIKEKLNKKQVFEKYNLQEIDIEKDIPKGSPVLNFDKIEDLQAFLATLEENSKIVTDEVLVSPTQNNQSFQTLSSGSTSVIRRTTSENTGFATVNLKADVTVYSYGSFRQINSIREWTDHTGTTFSLNWTQTYADDTISSDKQSATVVGGGELDYVIFFQGIGTLYTRAIDLSMTVRVS